MYERNAPFQVTDIVGRILEETFEEVVGLRFKQGVVLLYAVHAKCHIHQPSLTAGLVTIASECDLFG